MPDGLGTDDPHDRAMGQLDRLAIKVVVERLEALEDWLLGAEHHAGCSGEYKNADGTWAYRCKCGLRELRDER